MKNVIAIDTETTGLNPRKGARIICVGTCDLNGQKHYFRDDFKVLSLMLNDPTTDKVFHNAKFDMLHLKYIGIPVKGKIWDTMILAHLNHGLDSQGHLNLEALVQKYLPGHAKLVDEVEQYIKDNKINVKKTGFEQLPNELLKRRVVSDAELTLKLFVKLYRIVYPKHKYLLDIEHRLLRYVYNMQNRGVVIDTEKIPEIKKQLDYEIDTYTETFQDITGNDEFSPTTPVDQLQLLQCLNVVDQIKEFTSGTNGTKKRPKLTEYTLKQIDHPIVTDLQNCKRALKVRDTFINQFTSNMVGGKIHATFNQLGTPTGRFSCSNPNLQFIPDKKFSNENEDSLSGIGDSIRSLCLIRPGYIHIHRDFSRAELCVMAYYANDTRLKQVIESGEDVHYIVACNAFGESNVIKNPQLRDNAKRIVFGILYGIGNKKLAKELGVSIPVAAHQKRKVLDFMPGLNRWMKELEQTITYQGYTRTIHGRNHTFGRDYGYKAVNYMCQGTVGDEIKICMVKLGDFLSKNGYGNIILNYHDEIAVECPIECARDVAIGFRNIMLDSYMRFDNLLGSTCKITKTDWGAVVPYNVHQNKVNGKDTLETWVNS